MKAQKAETEVASEAEMFSEVNLRITLICVTDGCSLANVQGWSNAQLLCLTVCVKCSMLSQRTKTWCGETSLVSQQNRNHLITAELIFKSLIYIFLLSAKISFHHGGILTIPLDEKQMVPLQHHSLKYQAFVPKPVKLTKISFSCGLSHSYWTTVSKFNTYYKKRCTGK